MPSKPLSTPTSANLPIQTWKKVVPLYLGKMQPEVGGNSVVFTKHGMVHQNGWGGHGGKLGGEDRRISLESFLFISQVKRKRVLTVVFFSGRNDHLIQRDGLCVCNVVCMCAPHPLDL